MLLCRMNKSGALMDRTMTIVVNTVWYTGNLLGEWILDALTTKNGNRNDMSGDDMLISLAVVIILLCMNIKSACYTL